MKKFLTLCFVFCAGVALFAQKPLNIGVYEDLSYVQARDNDSRTGNLIQEYFKSELATHSGITVLQTDKLTSEFFTKRGFERGKNATSKQIADLCKDLQVDFFCFLRIKRVEENRMEINVRIYKADGTVKGEFKRTFESVRQSDYAAIVLAREAAIMIRGANPVDDINNADMYKRIENMDQVHKERFKSNMRKVK